ncbi:uncharacterized protein DSM5745_09817 [Aspergillus mulundensis]|uniref:Uncharacterized protein n=1 Tax=Aspergillus mulundensis TaxID=1810919 RepID=A0A3D8QRF8_9EURO|nr:hypothetical protein DSM5745_09817 [Aspergillus mulundensis]RDW64406.1 hypothetical protein DSM5745_09817 [Aspergillus mulundensis]
METPAHILTATIDLESRKTREEKRAELAQAQASPNLRRIEATKKRGCQKKSIQLIEQIARYLQAKEIPNQEIFCGCRVTDGIPMWQVYVMYGQPDMTEATRAEIREALIALFFAKPDRDEFVYKSPADVPFTLIMDWKYSTDWEHMTRLEIFDGAIFVTQVDGKADMREMFAYASAAHKHSALMSSVMRFADAFPVGEQERKGLSLDEALERIKAPSAENATG